MKKSLLQKAKARLTKIVRPKHKAQTRIRKGLCVPNASTVAGLRLIENSGLGIEHSRACRGRTKAFPRISRSKY